jgi:predicted dehydrogenase
MDVALVGYGKMGRFYDNLLQAKYIVDVRPVPGRVCFSYVEEFVAYGQPVAFVIVATPSDNHYEIAKKLLQAGYNVLVEKPICLSSIQAAQLEKLAAEKGLLLYQSTLERYNPLIKFLGRNVAPGEIEKIESFRFGQRPPRAYVEEVKFDLGVHDVDLWMHLFSGKVRWEVNVGFGEQRREIIVHLKGGKTVVLDLLNKYIVMDNCTLDFSKASSNNPILEMIYDISYRGQEMNESWSTEIRLLEETSGNKIILSPESINAPQ